MNCWIVPLFATFYFLFFLQLVYKCVMCSTVCVVVDESRELEIVQWKSRKFGPLWGTFVVAWPASPSQSPPSSLCRRRDGWLVGLQICGALVWDKLIWTKLNMAPMYCRSFILDTCVPFKDKVVHFNLSLFSLLVIIYYMYIKLRVVIHNQKDLQVIVALCFCHNSQIWIHVPERLCWGRTHVYHVFDCL